VSSGPNDDRATPAGAVKQLALAAVGAVSLTAERADELAETLATRGGMRKDEVRGWIDELATRWRGDATRLTERASEALHGTLRDLGLVTRTEWDELELRVAQLEHRMRLVESAPPPPRGTPGHP
jgi:polyhydroxyalkanoate synthesis regulator phasin